MSTMDERIELEAFADPAQADMVRAAVLRVLSGLPDVDVLESHQDPAMGMGRKEIVLSFVIGVSSSVTATVALDQVRAALAADAQTGAVEVEAQCVPARASGARPATDSDPAP